MSKFVVCTTSRVNSNVNYGLQAIVLYWCRFVSCDKCTLKGDAAYEGGCAYVEPGNKWEISLPSSQLCCEPKAALKS